ncbi:PspA/IM30 family protein [Paenibacillus oenotherae]|uniref:PspA/IM30 family protein n=1 Tax=Paenibacillus oenotherae TaxID=1435645 RepID=A0ABS7D7Z4_9BACL|nr:PspA/IM30 family protein [Paenibacillus oenotherae]MBW7476060.1 PspA/IM30 family protein [Paenibacillus oenotherae]
MGVLTRLIDMTKAATNELLDKLEDPTMMMNHYVRTAKSDVESIQTELLKQEAGAKRLQLQAEEYTKLAEQSEARALEAMSSGQEALARELLSIKLQYAEKARESAAWSESAELRCGELANRLEEAKAELAVMQKKRDELAARAQLTAAKARASMTGCGTGLEGGGAAQGFQRMEDKIVQWEAQVALASRPYNGANTIHLSKEHGEAELNPSQSALVDEQLELLRKRLPAQ